MGYKCLTIATMVKINRKKSDDLGKLQGVVMTWPPSCCMEVHSDLRPVFFDKCVWGRVRREKHRNPGRSRPPVNKSTIELDSKSSDGLIFLRDCRHGFKRCPQPGREPSGAHEGSSNSIFSRIRRRPGCKRAEGQNRSRFVRHEIRSAAAAMKRLDE